MALRELVLSAAVGTAIAISISHAKAAEIRPEGWPVPDVRTATFLKERRADLISELPGKETVQRAYRTADGTYFNTLSVGGRLYGYYVDTDGRAPMEYMLVDYDNDSKFEFKTNATGSIETPDYLITSEVNR